MELTSPSRRRSHRELTTQETTRSTQQSVCNRACRKHTVSVYSCLQRPASVYSCVRRPRQHSVCSVCSIVDIVVACTRLSRVPACTSFRVFSHDTYRSYFGCIHDTTRPRTGYSTPGSRVDLDAVGGAEATKANFGSQMKNRVDGW